MTRLMSIVGHAGSHWFVHFHRHRSISGNSAENIHSISCVSIVEVQLQTAEMESRLTSQKDALTDQLERCMDQVADAYDRSDS